MQAIAGALRNNRPGNALKKQRTLAEIALGVTAVMCNGIAIAQAVDSDTSDTALTEIIVTAQRREQSLQEVPISVNVLSEKDLQEHYITNAGDLSQFSPGLSAINYGPNGSAYFSIHGQGQIFGVGAPGVVTYVAEVPETTTFLYDLSSVQVLKGPQGTLFGRNTTGGAILLTPKKPTDEFNGYASVRVGDYDRSDQEFALGGAIVPDILSFRVAGISLHRSGYTSNLADGHHLDNENRRSIRASLLFRPVAGVENYTIFQYDRINEAGTSYVLSGFNDVPTTPFVAELPAYLALQESRGPRVIDSDFPGYFELKKPSFINTTTWQIGDDFSVKNLLHYSKGAITTSDGLDGSPFRILGSAFRYEGPKPTQKSEEFQLRFDGHEDLVALIGVFFEKNDAATQESANSLSAVIPGLPDPLPVQYNFFSSQENKSKAVFAQGTWTFLQDWSLGVGFRHSKDKYTTGVSRTLSVAGGPPTLTPRADYSGTSSANTWNVDLDYKFTPDVMGYLTVRRGYKAGGLNAVTDPSLVDFDPEYVLDHSIGIKAEWSMGSLQMRTNADVFYDKYTDIQRSLQPPPANGGPPEISVQNAAKANIRGADLDVFLVASKYFDVALQYTWLKDKYDEFEAPPYGDLSGGVFPSTPKHQVSVTPAVHLQLPGDVGNLTAQATVFHQSEIAISVNNVINGVPLEDASVPGSMVPGYTRVDFRLAWDHMFGHPLTTSFNVRNLTDKDYVYGGFNNLTSPQIGLFTTTYGVPRMFNFEARYDF